MDLGLFQRQVADEIGVKECSIYNWEHGIEPELRFLPKIIEFLGYVPFDCPEDTIGRLAYYKRVHGLSLYALGKKMGRDPEQLADWLARRITPFPKSLLTIEQFLKAKSVATLDTLAVSVDRGVQ